jgi:hypothetical protein
LAAGGSDAECAAMGSCARSMARRHVSSMMRMLAYET